MDAVPVHALSLRLWGAVNCAGLMHYQYVADLDVESWAMQVDLRRLSRALSRYITPRVML